MIEAITTNIVRCDGCGQLLEKKEPFYHAYHKDLCKNCSGVLLQKIECNQLITKEEFDEIFDDLKHKI